MCIILWPSLILDIFWIFLYDCSCLMASGIGVVGCIFSDFLEKLTCQEKQRKFWSNPIYGPQQSPDLWGEHRRASTCIFGVASSFSGWKKHGHLWGHFVARNCKSWDMFSCSLLPADYTFLLFRTRQLEGKETHSRGAGNDSCIAQQLRHNKLQRWNRQFMEGNDQSTFAKSGHSFLSAYNSTDGKLEYLHWQHASLYTTDTNSTVHYLSCHLFKLRTCFKDTNSQLNHPFANPRRRTNGWKTILNRELSGTMARFAEMFGLNLLDQSSIYSGITCNKALKEQLRTHDFKSLLEA